MMGRTLTLTKEPVHYPKLNTILMVEKSIIKHSGEYSKTQVWNKLPQKMIYQTFKLILNYLEVSNKIVYDKHGKLVWVSISTEKLRKLVAESVEV